MSRLYRVMVSAEVYVLAPDEAAAARWAAHLEVRGVDVDEGLEYHVALADAVPAEWVDALPYTHDSSTRRRERTCGQILREGSR